jgi:hypothetical protein
MPNHDICISCLGCGYKYIFIIIFFQSERQPPMKKRVIMSKGSRPTLPVFSAVFIFYFFSIYIFLFEGDR